MHGQQFSTLRQGVVSVTAVSVIMMSVTAVKVAVLFSVPLFEIAFSPNHIVGVCLDDTSTLTARIHQSLKGQTRMHPKNTKSRRFRLFFWFQSND